MTKSRSDQSQIRFVLLIVVTGLVLASITKDYSITWPDIESPVHKKKNVVRISLRDLTRSSENEQIVCADPLLPVLDRVIDKTNSSSLPPQLIPRIIHVAWIRGFPHPSPRCLPYDYVKFTDRWKKQFPSYDFHFHDDQAVDFLLHQEWPEFPHLQKLLHSCIQFGGAVKIDIWRVLVLYKYGGFYSDIDAAPSVTFTQDTVGPNDSAIFLSDVWNRPSQGCQGMESRHPIAYFTMLEILTRVLAMEDISTVKPVFLTGPDALKFGYGKAMKFWNGSDIFEPGVHEGKFAKQIRKLGRKEAKLEVFNTEWPEIVPWNATVNMTKQERANRLLDTQHWKQMVARTSGLATGPCWDNMYLRDQNRTSDNN